MHTQPRRLLRLLVLCFSALTLGAAEAPDPLRLTRDVLPLSENVELTLDPARDDYTGRVLVDLVASSPFSTIRLHAQGPVISSAIAVSGDGVSTTFTVQMVNAEQGLVALTAPAPLGIGNYRLTLVFSAHYQHDGLGIYKTVSNHDPYLFTQFEDRHARKGFPCWDEPSFKINWQLTLKIPVGLEAVSNAAVANESKDAQWRTISFGRTPPMPSYLVALAVGPFEYVPVPGLPVPGRIVTPRGQAALGAEAARLAPPLLSRLEEYFGIPYPYAKLDQIAVPEYVYGAMENAGFITYTDRLLLQDPERPSFSQRRRLANVMAHEMAHMWFGDLVTMAWWDDLWLNESFADWMCARIVEHQFPEFRIQIQQTREIRGAMRSDALPSITAIRRKVTASTDLAQLADELTYSKGKGILGMVENWIGPAQFRAAMRTYFLQHSWGNTVANDLWAAFSATSGDDITALLTPYVEQPGVPIVSLAFEPDGQLRISQRRFHNLGDPQLAGHWQVPLVVVWGQGGQVHRTRLLLKEQTQVFAVPGLDTADWIYPNADEAGYYRWSLAPALNARLVRHAAALKPIERIGLLDNASALFTAGEMDGTDYLAYVTTFGGDTDPDVSASVIAMASELRGTYVTPRSMPAYRAYMEAMLRPALDRIGLRPVAGEPPTNEPLRSALYSALGHSVGDPDVVAECRRQAALFLEDPRKVGPALRAEVLGVTAYHGDAAFFAALTATLQKTRSPLVRTVVIGALAGFHDPAIATQAMDFSLTPALNSTEFLMITLRTAGDPDHSELATNWVMKHFDEIRAKAPPEYTDRLIGVAAAGTPELFNQLRDFLLAPGRRTEYAEVNITKSSERMTVRQRMRAKEQAHIEAYLATFPGKSLKD